VASDIVARRKSALSKRRHTSSIAFPIAVPSTQIQMDDLSHKSRRQRAILSCNDCRRRKLNCDRLSPCDRCIKRGIQESCAYGTKAHSVASEEMQECPKKKRRQARGADRSATTEERHTSEIEENGTGRDDQLRPDTAAKQRLEQLERDIALLQQHIPSHIQEPKDQIGFLAQSPELKGIIHSSAVMGMLKGRSFATQFYGPSSLVFIIAHVSFRNITPMCPLACSHL
jgi:hypothetical protein